MQLGMTIISFSSFGIISASFVMVLKRGDPISSIFTSVSGILGGTVLPRFRSAGLAAKIVVFAAGHLFPGGHETGAASGIFFKRANA